MFDKFKQSFARFALKALNLDNTTNYGLYGGYSHSYGTVENHTMQILESCTSRIKGSYDPKDWIELSDMLYITIPLVQRAIQKRSAFIGRICVEADGIESEQMNAVLKAANDFVYNCPLLKEQPNTPKLAAGLNTLAYDMVESCQRVGMTFLEERFDSEGNFIGIIKYNPRNFWYQKTDGYNSDLYYNQQKVDLESPFFQYLGLEYEDGYDWGKPLIYGAEWAANSFLRVNNAAVNGATRRGNPATLSTIVNSDAAAFEQQPTGPNGAYELTPIAKQYSSLINGLRGAMVRGLVDMANGKSSHTVASIPGKDLTISTQTYGDGVTGDITLDTLNYFAIILSNALDISVEEFSILLRGGGGFNGERFKMLQQSLGDWITATRNDVGPILLNIIKNQLRRLGFAPKLIDQITIEWEYSDYETDKERAEIEKIEAETDEKVMNVWEKMYMVNPDAANRYAAENGIIIEDIKM